MSKNRPEATRFSGTMQKMQIISSLYSCWNRPMPYDEVEQRITITDRGMIWLTRYDRAPFPHDPDQLLSQKCFRVSADASARIMNVATEFFCAYGHRVVRDAMQWHANLVNTEGAAFYTEGLQGKWLQIEHSLTKTIREELGITDLVVVGDDAFNESDVQEPPSPWHETISLEEAIHLAKEGINAKHDRRVELLKALEFQYWYNEGMGKENRNELCMLMHKYVVNLETERPVRHSRTGYTWMSMVEETNT